ncbi:MAG: acyl-CoA dehydrogenase [Acidobacteriota bacterium]|jgi:alkylation response protein AidB-like acyl-CoA dehydrogenase
MEIGVWREALDLESFLADPQEPSNPLAHAPTVRWDEEGAFPAASVATLRDWGFPSYLVPEGHGGRLANCEQMLALTRVAARRDLTTTITLGQTWLGALPVWLDAEPGKCRTLARHLREGHLGCLALTEQAHGSDLAATEARARLSGGTYALSGSKWLINNATMARTMVVLAHTPHSGKMTPLSLLFLEKDELPAGSFEHLPRIPTHGIRGADIAGIRFRNTPVPASAVLGNPGDGFLLTLKTLQVTRIQCAGFSLGAADTALRAALEFALDRRLYGATVVDIPSARSKLLDAYLDLLICEAVALAASRAIHVLPHRLSLWSAATKYLVPVTAESLIRRCAVVFGARHFLREGHRSGIFQKMMRDASVVSFFDGSTAINTGIIAAQLRPLRLRRARGGGAAETAERRETHRQLFDLSRRVGGERFVAASDLGTSNHGFDDIVDGLELLAGRLNPSSRTEVPILELLRRLLGLRGRFDVEVQALDDARDWKPGSIRRSALAERYCLFVAAGACAGLWFHNRDRGGDYLARGDWLVLCLSRLVAKLEGTAQAVPIPSGHAGAEDSVWEEMVDCVRGRRLFSLLRFPLAPSGSRSPGS